MAFSRTRSPERPLRRRHVFGLPAIQAAALSIGSCDAFTWRQCRSGGSRGLNELRYVDRFAILDLFGDFVRQDAARLLEGWFDHFAGFDMGQLPPALTWITSSAFFGA